MGVHPFQPVRTTVSFAQYHCRLAPRLCALRVCACARTCTLTMVAACAVLCNARVRILANLRVLELLICQQVALRRPCKHLQQLNIPDADLKCRLPPSFPGRINARMGTVDHGCQLHLRLRGSSGRDDPEILQRPKNTNTLSERVVVATRCKQDVCPSGDQRLWYGMARHGMAESVWASSRYEAGCPETSGITTEKRAKSSARRGSSPVNHCSKNW